MVHFSLEGVAKLTQSYAFTNENLKAYLPRFNVAGKKVCTVMGSGDQPINLALLGAKKLRCFDLNPMALLWGGLKIACAKTLSFDQFKEFFFAERDGAIDPKAYDTVRGQLDDKQRAYWDEFVRLGNYKRNFLCDYGDIETESKRNLYIGADYNAAQTALRTAEIKFSQMDMFDLPVLGCKYNGIFLSNIENKVDTADFGEFIEQKIPTMLSRGSGEAAVCYYYTPRDNNTPFSVEKLAAQNISTSKFEFDGANYYGPRHHIVSIRKEL